MEDYKNSPLWKQAFLPKDDSLDDQRNMLVTAYAEFRKRVSLLVTQIHKDMQSLTVHDITHIDALWWTASEIAGPDYPLNPAEAFVLGGAFLLHDAAHCIAAYPGGIEDIRKLPEWKDFSARLAADETTLLPGSTQFQLVLFDVLRTMHPKQAQRLAKLHWSAPGDDTPLYLLPHDDLRQAYGDAIGKIAESHWWSPHELEVLCHNRINPPACLHPAPWIVDILKLAVLLRTADAAHIDAQRAPRFLLALVQPGGSSLAHWQFQTRMHKVKRDPEPVRHELRLSGTAFPASEQDAWWMAYDTARLIDNELRAADRLLVDNHRQQLATRSVAFSYSPEAFACNVPTDSWHPVDTSIKITDIKALVERFGGEKLYGKNPAMALRELLQNAVDAIHACRKLGGLGEEEGAIEVAVEEADEGHWLHVTDTGIGMSRYVLTDILLDFGRSLWRSADLRGEWSDLPSSGFEAIGQFGIGFFSVFMLGERVKVTTRRYEPKKGESGQWLLEFTAGTNQRPLLRVPEVNENLKKHGTRVSVLLSKEKLLDLCPKEKEWVKDSPRLSIAQICACLAPALDIDLYVHGMGQARTRVVKANDWLTLPQLDLLKRVLPNSLKTADADKLHLSELRDSTGQIRGRCAVISPLSYPFFTFSNIGAGVVKGLFAGAIEGMAGIIFAIPQNELARKSAIPDISLLEVQRWAEEQKELLLKHGPLDSKESAMLARFGASHTKLTFGKLGGQTITYDKLISVAREKSTVLVHQDEVDYDNHLDESIARLDFENDFVVTHNLLELTSARIPDWLKELPGNSVSIDTWSLDAALASALNKAWGTTVNWHEEEVVVGSVGYTKICRDCRIAIPD